MTSAEIHRGVSDALQDVLAGREKQAPLLPCFFQHSGDPTRCKWENREKTPLIMAISAATTIGTDTLSNLKPSRSQPLRRPLPNHEGFCLLVVNNEKLGRVFIFAADEEVENELSPSGSRDLVAA